MGQDTATGPSRHTSDGVVVLGAGLAGLSAAAHLRPGCAVYEKETYVGGHCRSKEIDGFVFDEGAHVFFGTGHCANTFIWEPLKDELLPQHAEIWNNYGGRRFGRYPVQSNAHALPAELATQCVLDFIAAASQPPVSERTYEEWCRASFGKTFAEEFLLKYARKVWTVDPSELTLEWLGSSVGGRIARPSLDQVIRGAITRDPQSTNYLTRFSYPMQGGFGRIVAPLARHVPRVNVGCGVARVDSRAKKLTLTDGSEVPYEAAISTLPLPSLVALTTDAPADVRAAAAGLMWTSIRCVNLGVARPDVGPGHWVYFYDPHIPFFRISFPSRLSAKNAPPGHTAITCEVAYSANKPLQTWDLMQRVVQGLRTTGILKRTDRVVLEDEIDVPYAYVVFDFKRTECLKVIHSWMESVGLFPCGRFAEWGYHWSFEAIESGRRIAQAVAERFGLPYIADPMREVTGRANG